MKKQKNRRIHGVAVSKKNIFGPVRVGDAMLMFFIQGKRILISIGEVMHLHDISNLLESL